MKTNLSMYLSFQGNAAEVMDFYSKTFMVARQIMKYSDAPGGNDIPGFDDKVMHGELIFNGHNLMFCDTPHDDHVIGSNFALTYHSADHNELRRIFDALSNGGEVHMELEKTFFADLYGMVTDKFGISWNLMG